MPSVLTPSRKFAVMVAVLVLSATAALGWTTTRIAASNRHAAETTPPPPTLLTSAVESRRLTNTLISVGTLATEYKVPIVAHATGTDPVVTLLPLAVGSQIQTGTLLAEVSGRPIVALPGAIPSYRDLTLGDQGRDVAQLQAGLKGLGLRDFDSTGTFGKGTAIAMTALYKRLGYLANLTPATTNATDQESPTTLAVAPQLSIPRGELAFIPELPATVSSLGTSVGQDATGALLTVASGKPTLRVQLTDAETPMVKTGQTASVTFDDGARADGNIVAISAAATAMANDPGADAQTTAPGGSVAVVDLNTNETNELTDSSAQVVIELSSSNGNIIAVPVTAVHYRADGSSVVTKFERGREYEIVITRGMTADGMIGVTTTDNSIREGDQVVTTRP